MTILADVVAASTLVSETSSRSRKVAILAELLKKLDPDEVPICVGFLSGVPRQGRVGVGYSKIYSLSHEPAAPASLTVADVDQAIDEIERATGPGSAGVRGVLLADLFGRATAPEAAFLRRLFTGELRQGALAGVMPDAVAKAAGVPGEIARRALMLSGDLTRMAEIAMTEGEEGLRRVGFEIFRPILPMLASTGATVTDAMAGSELSSVEFKLDGIRIQIHRRGEEVRIYTRNLNEITATLPGIVEVARSLPVRQAVLDGEALWMRDGSPAAFQDTVSQIDTDGSPEGIVTFVFDLLHVDGENLLDSPLTERAARLASIAPGVVAVAGCDWCARHGPCNACSRPRRSTRCSVRCGHDGIGRWCSRCCWAGCVVARCSACRCVRSASASGGFTSRAGRAVASGSCRSRAGSSLRWASISSSSVPPRR
jgi:DNA ligase 1